MNRSLGQQRAMFALDFIEWYRQKPKDKQKKLATHIHKTAIRILNNRLGQALAFLLADNENKQGGNREPSADLYDKLQEWLCKEGQPCRVYKDKTGLIKQLMEKDRHDYIRAQEEALLLFDWLVKFADAYLSEGG